MNSRDMSIYENLFGMLIITFITILFNSENLNEYIQENIQKISEYFTNNKCKTIVLEGKSSFSVTNYSSKTDNIFSDRFQAFWDYIYQKIILIVTILLV